MFPQTSSLVVGSSYFLPVNSCNSPEPEHAVNLFLYSRIIVSYLRHFRWFSFIGLPNFHPYGTDMVSEFYAALRISHIHRLLAAYVFNMTFVCFDNKYLADHQAVV